MFLLKKIISYLILPPVGPLLIALFGLVLAKRRPRVARAFIWLGLGSLALLSLPVVSSALLRSLEVAHPPTNEDLKNVQAIVILGAGRYENAPEYGGETIDEDGLERLRYGARLAKATGLPVAIAGGAPSGGVPVAVLMRDALVTDFNVETRWLETLSRDTAENAEMLAPNLRAASISNIALVTHAWHMRRAGMAFEAQGFRVVPAPTRFAPRYSGNPYELLPQAGAIKNSRLALHEWLGLLAEAIARHLPWRSSP